MPREKSKPIIKSENWATAAVHSAMMIGLAAAVFHFFGAGFALPPDSPKIIAAASNCPGTKLNYPRVITQTIRGKKISFRYNCIRSGFLSTSYDGNCQGCSGRTHFTNEPVVWGICAVDPEVIKPHSYFYVPGYGTCKAADKGGGLKGKHIDLGFDDVRNGWWSRRYTDIYTLVK